MDSAFSIWGGALDPKTRARFNEDLPAAYPKALADVLLLLGRTRWARSPWSARAAKAEELVNEAITRMLEGTRTWDPASVPDLHFFLREAARSMLSAEFESPEADTLAIELHPSIDSDPLVAAQRDMSAEDSLVDQQGEQLLINELLDAAGSDPVLDKVVTALMNGTYNAADIAAATGLEVEAVYQATRKLRRRARAARKRALQ